MPATTHGERAQKLDPPTWLRRPWRLWKAILGASNMDRAISKDDRNGPTHPRVGQETKRLEPTKAE